ncbi:MAG: sulfatase [Planctomycetota bacterium]
MKATNLLQGVLMGACLAGWASLVEAFSVYAVYAYHADPVVWTGLLPLHLMMGAAFGLLCALFLPLVTRPKAREDQYNLHLGLFILTAGVALVLLVEARMAWLPVSTSTFSGTAMLTFGSVVACSVLAYLILYRLAASSIGWAFSSFCSRFATILGLAVLLGLGAISWMMPVRPAVLAEPNQPRSAFADSPNVLFVVLDTTSARHLGSYGYHRATSPRLDSLASEGVLFENAYSAAPWTLPSHSSMFTGMLPNTHGCGWKHPRLGDGRGDRESASFTNLHTMQEEFAQRGYDTVMVAEKSWLSMKSGTAQGYDTVFDYSIPDLKAQFFTQRFWVRYQTKFGFEPQLTPDKGGSRVVDTALDWIDGHRARDQAKPFYMFMNLNEAHDPYQPPRELMDRFLQEGVTEEEVKEMLRRNTNKEQREITTGEWDITEREMEIFKSLYDAEILYQDGLLGRLFDGLSEQGLMEDTVIVITADHGEEFGELNHRVGHQMALTDRLLHVPLIMRFPDLLPAGKRISTMASTIDIYPTLLDIVEQAQDLEGPRVTNEILAIEGVSQLPAIQDGVKVRDMIMAHSFNPTPHLMVYEQWDPEYADGGMPDYLSKLMRTIDVLRTEDEKLYMYGDGKRAFIDLVGDPVEFGSELDLVKPEDAQRAQMFEDRFDQQITSYQMAHERLVGRLFKFRSLGNDHTGGFNLSKQSLEAIGYVGDDLGESTELAEPITLPPLLEFH